MNDYTFEHEEPYRYGKLSIYIPPAKNCTVGNWLVMNCEPEKIEDTARHFSELYPQR